MKTENIYISETITELKGSVHMSKVDSPQFAVGKMLFF